MRCQSVFLFKTRVSRKYGALALCLLAPLLRSTAQSAPTTSDRAWHGRGEAELTTQASRLPDSKYNFDPVKQYTLAELIDLAERYNPETKLAWQQAKARAEMLGVARSELYPTIAAVAVASTERARLLINSGFYRQTSGEFAPELHLEYLLFDFGGRSGAINAATANLLAANMAFNDTHLKVIFTVTSAYYRLLNAIGQQGAAQANLKNAQAVEEDAKARLDQGLATNPDMFEATAATAQALYDLQAAIGMQEVAYSDLCTALGIAPQSAFHVQDIDALHMPPDVSESVNEAIDRAFSQRPDLKQQIALLRTSDAAIQQMHAAYFPSLSFSGNGGEARQYGVQDLLPPAYKSGEVWDASLSLKWTLFDGARRQHEVAQAKAEKAATQAEIDILRDQISNQVWTAYSNMQTAQRQRQAAAALLASASQSYESALESYNYGLRNLLDVVAAQKALAQARTVDVSARTQLLLQVADLAFRTGDLLTTPPPRTTP